MKKTKTIVVSDQIEFERLKRSVNLKFWLMMLFLSTVTLVGMFMGLVGLTKQPAVIVYDKGVPILFTETSKARHNLTDVRIEHFVKTYLGRYAGIDSANTEEDVMDVLNMSTPTYRKTLELNSAFLANRKKMKFPNSNMKTTLSGVDVYIGKYDSSSVDGQIKVVVVGRLDYEEKFEELAGAESPKEKPSSWILAHMLVQQVPVTVKTIYGILTSVCTVDYFDSKEKLDDKLRALQRV